MMDSTLHYTSVSHSGSLMATINKMRVNSDLCDVTVVVGEYRIMAHRIILSASAPFFYQMLQLHSQPQTNENNEVQLNNIDEIAALKIIEFCYTSAISLDDDTVWPLLAASIKFQLPEICTFCCEFLVAGLDTTNCILSLRLAAKVHCPQLEENCVRFLLENIDKACLSSGLTSLSTPDLYSLLSVLVLHDVGPATMAKLVSVWMDVNRAVGQDGVFAQLLQVFPSMAPYLLRFSQQRGRVSYKDASDKGEDITRKGVSENSNKFDEMSLSNKERSATSSFGMRIMKSVYDKEDKESHLQSQDSEKVGDSSPMPQSLFGIGASREFICISCGDDFDCEEELLSHQNECDESAKMVGSASGDSLREGLSGRKKLGDDDDINANQCELEEEENCENSHDSSGANLRKRKVEESAIDSESSRDIKMGKLSENVVSDCSVGQMGSESVEGIDSDDKVNKTSDSENNTSLTLRDENEPSSERSNRTADSTDTEIYVPERDDNRNKDDIDEQGILANDNNNNAIDRLGGGFGKDDKIDDDNESASKLDIVLSNKTDCRDDVGKYSSFPDILSSSSNVYSTESHFKTRKLLDVQGWRDKNRYSSSSAGLSSSIAVSSSSSSLLHLRPQQRCQICGRSFWEPKQLSQHWVLDHGVKSRAVADDNDDELEQLSSLTTLTPHHHMRKAKKAPSKLTPGKEVQTDVMGMQINSWPFSTNSLGQGLVMDSLFKSGSAFRNTQVNGWEDGLRFSSRDADSIKSQDDVKANGTQNNQNDVAAAGGSRQQIVDKPWNDSSPPDQNFKSPGINDSTKDHFQGSSSRSSPTSFSVKQENPVKKEVSSSSDGDLKSLSLLGATGNLPSPAGNQGLASNEFLANYLNHYNKLAQWCLAQGPNFCPACLVYHTSGSPCPRSQNSLLSEKHQLYNTVAAASALDKREKVKEERPDDEEDKEVNVDGVDEEDAEEGPLDMSKSALEFSGNNNNPPSLSSSASQFITPSSDHHPHHQHDRPPSSSSSSVLGSIPPYYGYGHFLSGNSIMDMSAAMKAAVAAGGSLGDLTLMPRQSPLHDLTSSAIQTGSGREQREQQQQSYNSYLHHHALSTSAIAAHSSMANNVNNSNGSLIAPTAFSSVASRVHNSGFNGVAGVTSHEVSSASSPSSIFSFPSSPPSLNTASSSSLSSSRLPPPTLGGGKKKSSATGAPPKQGFPCTVCNRVYSHQSALFTHMRSHSPSTRSYRCQFCNESFARAPDLKVHVCPNGIEKPFSCPSCGQTFAKNIHLKRHLATHSGLKPYPCWVCGKRFSRSDHLKRHTQSIHAGARPHACHICGKEFVRKYELNKHMTSHN